MKTSTKENPKYRKLISNHVKSIGEIDEETRQLSAEFSRTAQELLAGATPKERPELRLKIEVLRAELRMERARVRNSALDAQQEERAKLKKELRGGIDGRLERIAEFNGGQWILYRRPWTDSLDGWKTLCVSQQAGSKRKRLYAFGWNGMRLSQRGDAEVLRRLYPAVYEWVKRQCQHEEQYAWQR